MEPASPHFSSPERRQECRRGADMSGERSRPGTSLAPLTVAAGNRQAELPISDSESISWQTVSNGWLVESGSLPRRAVSSG